VQGVPFELKLDPAILGGLSSNAKIEIATQPTLGQDGTLAEEFTVESVLLHQGDAFPDTFSGTAYDEWTTRPGRCYWQPTWVYAGGFTIVDTRDGYSNWRFRGLRAKGSCLNQRSVKRCARRVRWG
jgi:hypothetical protein